MIWRGPGPRHANFSASQRLALSSLVSAALFFVELPAPSTLAFDLCAVQCSVFYSCALRDPCYPYSLAGSLGAHFQPPAHERSTTTTRHQCRQLSAGEEASAAAAVEARHFTEARIEVEAALAAHARMATVTARRRQLDRELKPEDLVAARIEEDLTHAVKAVADVGAQCTQSLLLVKE